MANYIVKNYNGQGIDLSFNYIFASGTSSVVTGYKDTNGVDIGTTFMAWDGTLANKAAVTNYKVGTADLNTKFQKFGAPVPVIYYTRYAKYYGAPTEYETTYNGIYTILKYTTSGYLTFTNADVKIGYIIVGGGGAGGNGNEGTFAGEGGRGGTVLNKTIEDSSTTFTSETTYTIEVGSGGINANGNPSQISGTSLVATGGVKGADNVAGGIGSSQGGGSSFLPWVNNVNIKVGGNGGNGSTINNGSAGAGVNGGGDGCYYLDSYSDGTFAGGSSGSVNTGGGGGGGLGGGGSQYPDLMGQSGGSGVVYIYFKTNQ